MSSPPPSAFPISVLDYGAGNILSLLNALTSLSYTNFKKITTAQQIRDAECIIFPGVGAFSSAMESLERLEVVEALKEYVKADRPYFGICLGMQTLFESSEEGEGIVQGLGIIKGTVDKFKTTTASVPSIGWNTTTDRKTGTSPVPSGSMKYFVHSYRALPTSSNLSWVCTTTDYGGETYISSVENGNVFACQFHPEKSGTAGLSIIRSYLDRIRLPNSTSPPRVTTIVSLPLSPPSSVETLCKRVVVALDVRSNDSGDLVVTKGDQYDVRETKDHKEEGKAKVRNLGKPAELARKYAEGGADEISFLNITSFRSNVISDLPLVDLLKFCSERIFVPLTVGGGIRDILEGGKVYKAVEVADRYFRAGADKVSIGSDSVEASLELIEKGYVKEGESSIEQISARYGVQAVVVSIDPKRVYVDEEGKAEAEKAGYTVRDVVDVEGERRMCWWQATVKGGRETRDIDAVKVAECVEQLGAGEIMLNCIDMDGQGNGYDLELMKAVTEAVGIPVIASSGAGGGEHFVEVFRETNVSAALAAGIFHRGEVKIDEVKDAMLAAGVVTRK
mmetsp:Transcript_24455/g.45953  ORF Transcript_24455/g.45953 Transcript_24455/m.45953 type:complete len:563 (+) Transcript_24455:117-1805(+)